LTKETTKRKTEHINISLKRDVQARSVSTGFEDVGLIHNALPEIDKQKLDLSTRIFGHEFAAPIVAGAITGGTKRAAKINATIAEAVETLGLGMGVGSQRVALEDRKLEHTFAVARKKAPTAFLIANIGGVQLRHGYGLKEVKRAIEIAKESSKPVIVKETGAGIASEESRKLEAIDVKGVDVGGAGGTSFAAVEYYRAKESENSCQRRLGNAFWDWGIPTAVSIVEVAQTVSIPVIASGGIRTGVEVAKALTLGSDLTSLSQPILRTAAKGVKETSKLLSHLIDELKNAMFLMGVSSIENLSKAPIVITGQTAEWLNARGFNVHNYAQRQRSQP
jgi:isopentenyl-diphosphate delta-isomerase